MNRAYVLYGRVRARECRCVCSTAGQWLLPSAVLSLATLSHNERSDLLAIWHKSNLTSAQFVDRSLALLDEGSFIFLPSIVCQRESCL
jgi:hypothetical protein